jgi:hypothetical protein
MSALSRFTGKVFIAVVAVHVVSSACMSIVMSRSYRERMPNVRLVDADPRTKQSLIASYLRSAADDGRPVTCFVGSSFTWGYPWAENAALTAAAGDAIADSRTVNASIINAGLEATRNTLAVARESNVRFARVVVEIPVVNELSFLEIGCSWTANCMPPRPEPFRRTDRYARSYREYFLKTPGGWRVAPAAMGDEGDDAADGPVQLAELPKTYFLDSQRFAAVREAYGRSIVATLDAARQVTDEVAAFPTPIYVTGAETLGFERAALEEQIAFTLESCRQAEGVLVVELEPRHLTDASLFANVTHFNRRGNREFGAWLAKRIAAGERGSGVASGVAARR